MNSSCCSWCHEAFEYSQGSASSAFQNFKYGQVRFFLFFPFFFFNSIVISHVTRNGCSFKWSPSVLLNHVSPLDSYVQIKKGDQFWGLLDIRFVQMQQRYITLSYILILLKTEFPNWKLCSLFASTLLLEIFCVIAVKKVVRNLYHLMLLLV